MALIVTVKKDDFQLASEFQQEEIIHFIESNADDVSPERVYQVESFRVECHDVANYNAALELEAEFERMMLQEHADQNMARQLANLPPLPRPELPSALRARELAARERALVNSLALLPRHKIANEMSRLNNSEDSSLVARLMLTNPGVKSLLTPSKPFRVDPSAVKSINEDFGNLRLTDVPQQDVKDEAFILGTRQESRSRPPFPFPADRLGCREQREVTLKWSAGDARRIIGHKHNLTKSLSKTCVVCDEKTYFYAEAPCKDCHVHCSDCLTKLFTNAMLDRSLLPVRCCKVEMDQNLARYVLTVEDFEKFAQIQYEEQTVNKMYCSNVKCAAFLDLDRLMDLGLVDDDHKFQCPSCDTTHCASCQTVNHPGMDCFTYMSVPEEQRNATDAAFFELARSEGLQRCKQCRAVVQLVVGCNHMTCHCRYEFCYPCGAQWKTCTCPQVNSLFDCPFTYNFVLCTLGKLS